MEVGEARWQKRYRHRRTEVGSENAGSPNKGSWVWRLVERMGRQWGSLEEERRPEVAREELTLMMAEAVREENGEERQLRWLGGAREEWVKCGTPRGCYI